MPFIDEFNNYDDPERSGLKRRLANSPKPDNSYVRSKLDRGPSPSSRPPLSERLNAAKPNNTATRAKLGPLGRKSFVGPNQPGAENFTRGAKSALTKGNAVKNPVLSSAPILNAIGADQYNQAELGRNIEQGNLGLGTGIRGIASLASRTPQYFAGMAADSLKDNPYLKGAEGLAKKGFEALGNNSLRDSLTDAFYALDPAGIRSQTPKSLPSPDTGKVETPSATSGKTESDNQAKYNFNSDQGLYDFVNSQAYQDEMRNAGLNVDKPTVAQGLAGTSPQQGALNIFGQPVQSLTPQGTYFDQGVEVIPWDQFSEDTLSRVLPKDQYIDMFGQLSHAVDGDGKVTGLPQRLNPGLNPDIMDMQRKELALKIANANQQSFEPIYSETVNDQDIKTKNIAGRFNNKTGLFERYGNNLIDNKSSKSLFSKYFDEALKAEDMDLVKKLFEQGRKDGFI